MLPFEDAVGAYERIQRGEQSGVGLLFRYSPNGSARRRPAIPAPTSRPAPARPVVRFGVIGAGNYATSMLLPHLQDRTDVRLVEVATATGLSAANAQRRFGFERCSTDHRGLLADGAVDAVVIATRHHAHAAMICDALRAGKAVFVEKPLAVDPDQLQAILAAVGDSGNDRLMVGFNRRFAPLLVDLKSAFGARSGPLQVRYDVNAGRLEAGSWYGQPEEGSRLVGEGCHFIDTVSWWLDQDPVAVFAAATGDPDDTASTLLYPDGSVATIAYQTGGRPPRTQGVAPGHRGAATWPALHNFQRTELWRGGRRRVRRSRTGIDKGQKQELDAFVRAVADARAHADPPGVARGHHPGHLRRAPQPRQPPPGGRGRRGACSGRCSGLAADGGAADVNLAWYAHRLATMSPAEMAGRARDELTRRRWRGRQVTDAGTDPTGAPVACPAFAALLPAAGDDVARGRPRPTQGGSRGAARRTLAGVRPRARRHGTGAGLVPGPDHRPAARPTGPTASTSTTATRRRSATSSTCGSRLATST